MPGRRQGGQRGVDPGRIHAEHEATGRLGIGQEHYLGLVESAAVQALVGPCQVAPASPRYGPGVGQLPRPGKQWHGGNVDRDVDPRFVGRPAQVPQEAEAGHVGRPAGPRLDGDPCRLLIESGHGGQGSADHLVGRTALLDGRGDYPHAQWLGEEQHVAGPEAGVGEHPIGMDLADHGQAELWLRVVDGVASGDHEASLGCDLLGAEEHLDQEVVRQLGGVPPHQIERQQGSAAHGVDVGHGVGRSHASPRAGVIDDRGDEVGGHHQGALVVEAPHGGVVAGGRPDQEVGIGHGCQAAHDVRQLARGELAASTGAVAELGQSAGLRHVVTPSPVDGLPSPVPIGTQPSSARVGGGSGAADDTTLPELGQASVAQAQFGGQYLVGVLAQPGNPGIGGLGDLRQLDRVSRY